MMQRNGLWNKSQQYDSTPIYELSSHDQDEEKRIKECYNNYWWKLKDFITLVNQSDNTKLLVFPWKLVKRRDLLLFNFYILTLLKIDDMFSIIVGPGLLQTSKKITVWMGSHFLWTLQTFLYLVPSFNCYCVSHCICSCWSILILIN